MDSSDSDDSGGLFSPKRRAAAAPGSPNGLNTSGPGSPSPAKGSGAELQATSPRGQPGASQKRKDPKSGKTFVEVTAYDKFDSNKEYSAMVEKAAKYSGKWVPRYITIRDIDLAYGLSETSQPKDTIRFHKATRGAELGRDPLSVVVEGTSNKERKAVEFVFRAKDADETEVWWLRCCHALAAGNQMDMPRDGLPLAHPRTGLAFVNIPIDHLAVFAPLDRLVLHFFAPAVHKHKGLAGRLMDAPSFVFIGDLCVYVCDPKADIKRCIGVRNIAGLLTVAGGDQWTVGLQCSLPEYDVLFSMDKKHAENFATALTALHSQFGVPKSAGKDAPGLKRQKLAKDNLLLPQLSLDPPEAYALKIRLPMSKRYLMKMVADGEQGGQLKIVKKVRTLALVEPAPAPTAKANAKQGEGGDAKTDGEKKDSEGNVATANPLADLSSTAGPGKKDDKPKPPAPPSSDDDSDDSLAGFMKKKKGDAAGKPPPPTFDDSDSDDGLASPKASPLSGAFGGATQNRTDKAGPSPPTGTSTSAGGGTQIAMGVDRMHRLLNTVGLPQYYAVLTERGVDWEIFSCMDTIDLKKFGVANVEHQIKIENALNDGGLMEALRKEPASGGGGGGFSSTAAPPPPPPASGGATRDPFSSGGAPPPPPGGSKAAVFIDDDDL
uniref:SAM domain-containing protein n=1 Tax=Neobodo designis TaxID=312471 RepID=A0A7S1QQB0_NEODS|mmetsp:Transcript_50145/g.154931  ORF Transcript_50145/g.154931 Transcript_50145/m.154931 type:complete len:662 (+) Transcript_50145:109-2094(+)